MRTLVVTAFIACAVATHAASIDGKWLSERQVGDADGKTYSHQSIFTLKASDGVLTGTCVQTSAAPWMAELTGRSLEILDGKIDGERFSFKLKIVNKNGERYSVYEGTVEGDQLKGTLKFRGIGITESFSAKRVN
jgi:hypothetical protein